MSDFLQAVTHDLLVRELSQVPQWDVLGIYLGLCESEIQVIERDHHDTARRRLAMLSMWLEKDVTASWEKVINALGCMSQIRLANQLKEKYIFKSHLYTSESKQADSSLEKELTVDRQRFHEMEALGDSYLQLVVEAESAVEESNPPLKKLKRFSQCFMSKEILTVDELFDQLKPFYFLEYIMLGKIVKFFLPQKHSVTDDLRDYLMQLECFKTSTTIRQFMESIEQAQQSHRTTSERPGLCTVKLHLVGGWLTKTMDDLEKLVNEIFKDKRDVLSHIKIVRGSVIVTFSAPLSEADSLCMLAREQSSFAHKVGVSLLVVAGTVITQNELSLDFSFESSLLDSVEDNDQYLLSFLLSIITNPDVYDKERNSPLFVASQKCHTDIVSLLLKANANPNLQTGNGCTPLYIASLNGYTDIVVLLLRANADPNIQKETGATPLYIASQNFHTNIVALLLKSNADPNLQCDEGASPLFISSQIGHTSAVSLLLKANAYPHVSIDDGATPLFIASQNGHTDAVSLLLNANVDPNVQRSDSCTPLFIASQNDHTDIVALLLKSNADPNLQCDDDASPLFISSQIGHTSAVSLLLKANAYPHVSIDDGATPLFIASQNGHTDTVSLLLKTNVDPNFQRVDGCTPLFIASQYGHTDIVSLLLKANANPNLQRDNGATPVYIASQNSHSDVVALLLKFNANPNLQCNDGRTPLYVANRRNHSDIVALLLNAGANKQARISSLPDLQTISQTGRSTLFQKVNPNPSFQRHVDTSPHDTASEK